MFKIQTLTETYNHNLKNILIDKKYILRKMSLKFQNTQRFIQNRNKYFAIKC